MGFVQDFVPENWPKYLPSHSRLTGIKSHLEQRILSHNGLYMN